MDKVNLEVELSFPNIDKAFTYNYVDVDDGVSYLELAMREFYEQEAPTLFALYGYAPMSVKIANAGAPVLAINACYQEVLWNCYFAEGGEPWFGRFNPFLESLMECRWSHDRHAKAA